MSPKCARHRGGGTQEQHTATGARCPLERDVRGTHESCPECVAEARQPKTMRLKHSTAGARTKGLNGVAQEFCDLRLRTICGTGLCNEVGASARLWKVRCLIENVLHTAASAFGVFSRAYRKNPDPRISVPSCKHHPSPKRSHRFA